MYYDEHRGTEVNLQLAKKTKILSFPQQNAVIFELKSDAPNFKTDKFKNKPKTTPGDHFELLSASGKDPALSTLRLDDVVVMDYHMNYKPVRGKERVGGLIYSRDNVVALHTTNETDPGKKGEAIKFSALIEEWVATIKD